MNVKSYICNYDIELNSKYYKFETDNIQMFECSSSKYINVFNKYIDKNSSSCVYILINDTERQIYIGQTSNIVNRINNHKNNKKFNRIIFFNKSDGVLSKTYIDYLEWLLIQFFIDKELFMLNDLKFMLNNSDTRSNEPIIQASELNIAKNYFDKIKELLELYGFVFINKIANKKIDNIEINNFESEIFYFKDTSIKYDKNTSKVIMLSGSIITNFTYDNGKNDFNFIQTINSKKYFFKQHKLSLEHIEGSKYKLKEDIVVNSPTFAAKLACGSYSVNGLICYKNNDKKTLKDFKTIFVFKSKLNT